MILETLVGVALVLQKPAPIVCPVMGSPVPENAKFFDYNGVRLAICCAGCATPIQKDAAKVLADATKKGWVAAEGLFDPVSGQRVYVNKAKGSSDFRGVRFHFESAANKAKFDASPAKYGVLPTKDSLVCPVSEEKIGGYANASNFKDVGGVRYYICCAGCIAPFDKDAAKFAAKVAKSVKTPGISNPAKNEGGHPERIHNPKG